MRPRPGESKKRYLSRFMAGPAHRDLAPQARVAKAHRMYDESRKPAATEKAGDRECKCGGTCADCKSHKDGLSSNNVAAVPTGYRRDVPRGVTRANMAQRESVKHFRATMQAFRASELRDEKGKVIVSRKDARSRAYKSACERRGKRIVAMGETRKSSTDIKSKEDLAWNDPLRAARQQSSMKDGKKGRVVVQGLRIVIEYPSDTLRRGTNGKGEKWERRLTCDYGHIQGVKGAADGEPVDVFLGVNPSCQTVYVIDQVKVDTREFDEPKVMLGFNGELEARDAYLSNYPLGYPCLGAITAMTMAEFKGWLKDGGAKKPASPRMRLERPVPLTEPDNIHLQPLPGDTQKSGMAAPQSATVQSLGGALIPPPQRGVASTHKHIVKLPSGKFRLLSRKKDPKTGRARNLGTFSSRREAMEHERAVEYFKHGGKSMTAKSESASTRRESEEHQKGSRFRKVLEQFKRGTLKNKAGEPITDWKQAVAVAYGEQRGSERAHGRPIESKKAMTKKCGGEGSGKPGPCPTGNSGTSEGAGTPRAVHQTGGARKIVNASSKVPSRFDSHIHPMPVGSKVTARKPMYGSGDVFVGSQERLEVLEHRGGEGTNEPAHVKVRNSKGEETWLPRIHLRGKTTGKGHKLPPRSTAPNVRDERFGEDRQPLIAGMKKSRWRKMPWRGLTRKSMTYRDEASGSFFAECRRDDKGHCTKGTGGKQQKKKQASADKPRGKPKPTRGEMVSVRREGKGKDAKLVLANGEPAPAHIRAGRIPPAWSDVTVSTDPDADVQIQGKNKKGKTQTLYSDKWDMKTAAVKFSRIHDALHEMPGMMEQVRRDRSDPKKAGAADCTWLMMEQGTRPGSEADNKGVADLFGHKLTPDDVQVNGADKKGVPKVTLKIGGKEVPIKDKKARAELARRKEAGEPLHDSTFWLKSHGATTLEGRHVVETKDGVRLQFMGKESVYHDHLIRNPELAKMLLERKKAAGESGKLFGVSDKQVSRYARKLDGGGFTPKDWRTAKGTRMAIEEIARREQPTDEKTYKAAVMDVAHKVSGVLGNEPEQALSTYISPAVFSSWRASAGV